jgi:hypothetical protein
MTNLNRAFGIELEIKGSDSTYAVRTKLHEAGFTLWQVVYDGSVDDGVEVVSPKLQGAQGLAEVEKVVNFLRGMGMFVDHQCGFHVHVDASGLSGYTLANIVKRYAAFESTIDSWMTDERRANKNGYLRSCGLLNLSSHEAPTPVANQLGGNRYYKVNLSAYLRHGTVEFRQHYGTLSVEEIQGWIQFCINFVNNSVVTVTETIIPGNGSLRANAIERKYAELIRHFLWNGTLRTGKAAEILGCDPDQVAVYFSRFRAWLDSQGLRNVVETRRGIGYGIYSYTRDSLRPLLNHPGLDRKETVINFDEPGLFHGLSDEIRENLEGRALAYELLALTSTPPAQLAA